MSKRKGKSLVGKKIWIFPDHYSPFIAKVLQELKDCVGLRYLMVESDEDGLELVSEGNVTYLPDTPTNRKLAKKAIELEEQLKELQQEVEDKWCDQFVFV
jgi:hypothetical protein